MKVVKRPSSSRLLQVTMLLLLLLLLPLVLTLSFAPPCGYTVAAGSGAGLRDAAPGGAHAGAIAIGPLRRYLLPQCSPLP